VEVTAPTIRNVPNFLKGLISNRGLGSLIDSRANSDSLTGFIL
jgi:hypothetical protein